MPPLISPPYCRGYTSARRLVFSRQIKSITIPGISNPNFSQYIVDRSRRLMRTVSARRSARRPASHRRDAVPFVVRLPTDETPFRLLSAFPPTRRRSVCCPPARRRFDDRLQHALVPRCTRVFDQSRTVTLSRSMYFVFVVDLIIYLRYLLHFSVHDVRLVLVFTSRF